MDKRLKEAAAMYALSAIAVDQVKELCTNDDEFQEALKYAEEYSNQYRKYLDSLEMC